MKNIMKKAHEMTREIKKEFPRVDYKAQLGICISFLYEENKKGNDKMEMAKLTGTEKQIKWAESLREEFIKDLEEVKNYFVTGKCKYVNVCDIKTEEKRISRYARGLRTEIKNNEYFRKFLLDLNIKEEKIDNFKKDDSINVLNNIDELKNKLLSSEEKSTFYINTRANNLDYVINNMDIALLKLVYEYLK